MKKIIAFLNKYRAKLIDIFQLAVGALGIVIISFLLAKCAFLIATCATPKITQPVDIVEPTQAPTPMVDIMDATMPVRCLRTGLFNETTGPRSEQLKFQDAVGGQSVTVHIDEFRDGNAAVLIVYHTFPETPELVCVLHTSIDFSLPPQAAT